MDVKNKYPLSPPKGALAADAKKNQDVYPKNLRKKEPISANNFPKNEQARKYNVQRTKDIVKRSRAKGQYHGCTEEDTKVVETKWAERGSVLVHGSKKENHQLKNGNHLLNFHYESRDSQGRNIGKSTRRYNHNSNRWLPPVQCHKYDKEQFLLASCQFVVTANGDYSLHMTNPDVLVNWKLIEQIKVHSTESFSCPICLCAPVAGKMTRCGHVYCWPCILHYMDVFDKNKTWCKCPICYTSVYKNDLKSVVEITQSTFNLGDILNLRLMRREKDSVLATPVESTMHPPVTFLSISENSANQIHSKLLIANMKDIIDIIKLERVQLKLELADNPDCFIEQALNELLERENKLLKEAIESKDALLPENVTEKEMAKQIPQENEINTNACYKDDTKTTLVEQSSKIVNSASKDNQSASSPPKFIYFYQAEDGQHLYLHAVNVEMLKMQYGSLEHCPPTITGKLLEREGGSYTEDLKRKLRYLSHLPLTCQFEIAEIELKPPLVSEKVLDDFREKLNLRQKRRKNREKAEKKREKQILKKQNIQMGKYPRPNISFTSNQHFPQWISEKSFSEYCASSPPDSITSSVASTPPSSTFDEVACNLEINHPQQHEQQQGPSFAEMLRNTGIRVKSAKTWSSITSSVQSKTCSSTSVASSNEDAEDYTSPPLNNPCFGDALARAWEQKSLESGVKGDSNAAGKKKKKKGKGTVLFTTGMTYES